MECQIAKTPEFPTLVCYKMQEPKLQKTKERWVQENKKTAREFLEYVVDVFLQDKQVEEERKVVVEGAMQDMLNCPHRDDNTAAVTAHTTTNQSAPQRNHSAAAAVDATSNTTPHTVCGPHRPLPGSIRLSAACVPRWPNSEGNPSTSASATTKATACRRNTTRRAFTTPSALGTVGQRRWPVGDHRLASHSIHERHQLGPDAVAVDDHDATSTTLMRTGASIDTCTEPVPSLPATNRCGWPSASS